MNIYQEKIFEINKWCLEQFTIHNISDWKLEIIDTLLLTWTGSTDYFNKYIKLNKQYVEKYSIIMIKNTILHEIAHVLVGKGHGHDNIWYQMAIQIGCCPKKKILLPKI